MIGQASTIEDRDRAEREPRRPQTTGTVASPDGLITVKVISTPDQAALVTWTMFCTESGSGVGSKSGQFTAQTPIARVMLKPATNTESCDVSANVQLQASGRVTISTPAASTTA